MRSVSLALLLSVAGCAAPLPLLEAIQPGDDRLDCAAIDRAILRADLVRDAAIEEGKVQAINRMIGAEDARAQVVLGPVALGVPVPSDAQERHVRAMLAAEDRMQQLLVYKRERACETGLSLDPQWSDAGILRRLHEIDDRYLDREIDRRERRQLRAELFDELR